MITGVMLFISLLAYSVIVSQSFMYLLALRDTQLRMDARSYLQFRKLVDRNMQAKFRFATYAALLATLLLIPVAFADGSNLFIAGSLVAFAALVCDTLLTIKGNLPINRSINSWTEDDYPADWSDFRARWLQFFQYRQMLNITGFVVLVAAAIFR